MKSTARGPALLLGLGGLLLGAGCATQDDVALLQRDIDTLRREMTAVSRTSEGSRVITEQRVGQVAADVKAEVARAMGQAKEEMRTVFQSQTAVGTKLDELAAETRLVQGRIEETGRSLAEIHLRLDDLARKVGETSRRMDTLDAQVKTLLSPPAPVPSPGPTSPSSDVSPSTGSPGSVPEPPRPPVASKTPPRPTAASPEEIYRSALNDYTQGNYDLAIGGFRTYLHQYPSSSLASNAQYWLAEAYFSQKNYRQAIAEFDQVIRQYKDSPKVPSAMLKQGKAYFELGQKDQGRGILKNLRERYPKTLEARQAQDYLK